MKWVRSIAAVLAGYAILIVTLRLMIGSFLRTLAVVIAGALVAGFVTAFIAARREIAHAAALGFILIATSLSIRENGQTKPSWLQIAVGGCGPIAAMVGAATRLLTKSSRQTS